MKTIIVATDYSKSALNAIDYAGALAAHTDARLVLFHAFQLPLHASNTLMTAAGVDDLLQSSKQQLEKLAQQTSKRFGVPAEAITKAVFLAEGLDALVAEQNAGVVVLGMHENDWGDRLFGNTTISVMRNAQYPVLIVPEKTAFERIEKILYAYDPTRLSHGHQLHLLRELAKKFGATVQVFHVEASAAAVLPNHATQTLRHPTVEAALETVAHDYRDVYQKDVVEAIEKGLDEYGANLLVVVPHRLELWKRLTKNSVTRRLAIETPLPLLVLPTLNEA